MPILKREVRHCGSHTGVLWPRRPVLMSLGDLKYPDSVPERYRRSCGSLEVRMLTRLLANSRRVSVRARHRHVLAHQLLYARGWEQWKWRTRIAE